MGMFFDPKKIFDAAYKKNKLLTCFVCYLSIILLVHVVWTTVYRALIKINNTKDIVLINSSEIRNIKKRLDEYEKLSHSIVTMPIFNAHIKRKDTEYHEQNELNNSASSKIGNLEGELNILSSFFSTRKLKNKDENE